MDLKGIDEKTVEKVGEEGYFTREKKQDKKGEEAFFKQGEKPEVRILTDPQTRQLVVIDIALADLVASAEEESRQRACHRPEGRGQGVIVQHQAGPRFEGVSPEHIQPTQWR